MALLAAIGQCLAQNPSEIKAGDAAPELAWSEVLQAPDPGSHKPPSLFGHVTVIVFLRNVSANASLASRWNALVEKFADQQVAFVWVTSEKQSTVQSWLANNPVRGWVLFDPKWQTARAYGMEESMSTAVIVEANGRIAGFTFMLPDEEQIEAVQDGRALAMKGDATDAQMNAILAGRTVRLDAEPYRGESAEGKPDIPPSYEVHISPSTANATISSRALEFWLDRGVDLPAMISEVYATDPSRIVLPASFDKKSRYDFVLVPPHEMDGAAMHRLIQQSLEQRFRLSISTEFRMVECYVMTVVEGHAPKPKRNNDSSYLGMMSWSTEWTESNAPTDGPPTIEMLRKQRERIDISKLPMSQISAVGVTIDYLRRNPEKGLHRPIVNETNLKGSYDFELKSNARSAEEFIQALRDQVGILLTPAQRNLEMLVVTAR